MTDHTSLIAKTSSGETLTENEMMTVMAAIMDGDVDDADIATLLTNIADRAPTIDEITGAARILRQKAETITAPDNAVDCCGTGGDGLSTYNVSTAVALVAAGCGVPMAKHGNRAVSSKAGAADTLEALGVNLDINFEQAEQALADYNFAFLMAPHHHKAMKHVAKVRKSLGFRTIFNILGPLANPANTSRQLIGVYDRALMPKMAAVLKRLGTAKAWIVHGDDGLDEITVTGPSYVEVLDDGKITQKTLTPEDYDMPRHDLKTIQGGTADDNAAALQQLLDGKRDAYRDITLMNAAAVLVLSDKVSTFRQGIDMAANSIDTGAAKETLNRYISFTQDKTDKDGR